MNPRIQALAEQAGAFPLYPDHPEGDCTMAFRERALERLVDMVVRECANLVRGVPTCGPGSKGCDEIIREHFHIR